MPVLELAQLRLLPGKEIQDEMLVSVLRRACKAMQDFSGCSFYFLHSINNPEKVYVLGEWPSVEVHVEDFVPGEENQNIVNEVKDRVEIVRLGHFDVRLEQIPTKANEIRIARWVMSPGEVKAKYETIFKSNEEEGYVGGWRVDPIDAPYLGEDTVGKEEYVCFEGLENAVNSASRDWSGVNEEAQQMGAIFETDSVKVLVL
jgi:hypothetical protein